MQACILAKRHIYKNGHNDILTALFFYDLENGAFIKEICF